MKVRIFAFDLKSGPFHSSAFFDHLSMNENVTLRQGDATKEVPEVLLHVAKLKDQFAGCILTIHNRKAYIEAKEQNGRYILEAITLGKAKRIAEVNYFTYNPAVKTGLYMHNRGSIQIPVFGVMLGRLHALWTRGARSAKTPPPLTHRDAKVDRRPYLRAKIRVHGRDYKTFLKEVSDLESLEYAYETPMPEELAFGHDNSEVVASVVTKVKYMAGTGSVDAIRKDIVKRLGKSGQLDKANIEGILDNGEPDIFRLERDYCTLDDFEHVELVKNVGTSIVTKDLPNSWPIKRLLQTANLEKAKESLMPTQEE